MTIDDIIEDYPALKAEDIYATLSFAADKRKKILPIDLYEDIA